LGERSPEEGLEKAESALGKKPFMKGDQGGKKGDGPKSLFCGPEKGLVIAGKPRIPALRREKVESGEKKKKPPFQREKKSQKQGKSLAGQREKGREVGNNRGEKRVLGKREERKGKAITNGGRENVRTFKRTPDSLRVKVSEKDLKERKHQGRQYARVQKERNLFRRGGGKGAERTARREAMKKVRPRKR